MSEEKKAAMQEKAMKRTIVNLRRNANDLNKNKNYVEEGRLLEKTHQLTVA